MTPSVRLLMVLAALLASWPARGQSPDVARADALFREGRSLLKKGETAAACPKLEESYSLDPAPGTAVNLGDCFERLGKLGSALLAYRAARDLMRPGDPRIAPVDKQISVLEKRAPKLKIDLEAGAPDGTRVTRDGRQAAIGIASIVNPGEHTIVVNAPGRASRVFYADTKAGETSVLEVGVGPLASPEGTGEAREQAAPKQSSANRPEADDSQRTLGYVVAGAGAVGLLAGGVFWLQGNAKYDEAGCSSTSCPRGELSDEGDAKMKSATFAAVLGGLALAGGLTLVLTAPRDGQGSARLTVSPAIIERGGGAHIGGVW